MKRSNIVAAAVLSVAASPALLPAALIRTTSFQNGVDGYGGTVNAVLSINNTDAPDASAATRTTLPLDGYAAGSSPDAQGLIRFDQLFGSGPGQVPPRATIVDARLELTTHNGSNSQSGGPYGVAALLSPFDPAATAYSNFAIASGDEPGTGGNRGPHYANGTATRAVGGIGNMALNEKVSVNVTPFAHAWSTGALANHGLVVQSGYTGTSDGWTPRAVAHATVADRPKLTLAYTTDRVGVARLQQDVNGYTGTAMALVEREPTSGTDLTTDGTFLSQEFLDEGADSNNQRAAIRFGDLAQSLDLPDNADLLSAHLVVTTGDASGNARSPGQWRIDELSTAWDATTLYSQFGPNGPEGAQVASVEGVISGSEAWFDVTASVEKWLVDDSSNLGWVIRSAGTGDGWQVHFAGSEEVAARPELVVMYSIAAVPEPSACGFAVLGAAAALRRRRRRRG